jgi:hypothetical protein
MSQNGYRARLIFDVGFHQQIFARLPTAKKLDTLNQEY